MLTKLLLAALIAYAGWWLWQGPRSVHRSGRRPGPPPSDECDAALAVLGLDAAADDAAIRAAHRRLIQAVHPDRGGSADLARRINEARDTLLARRL
ncbi:J domain-containing protein [uncultured Sphingomonas sp.]|uniref:J domain-containing protein n=1 Tax=uncultured Sphingomonas sp. TaxID=158754 RepID=UPI0035CA789F